MEQQEKAKFVAGVGASAGGLESLERFFRNIPLDSGVAFVVVQHLSADHKSLMEELLQRFTRIPVSDARNDEELLPNHIYLLPPGKELELQGDRLAVFDRDAERALSFPIDRFLSSLAEQQGPRSISVILSGSGSDGSRGVRKVSAQGGLVLVEDPEIAAFDGMPLAAIETGCVDAVLAPDGLARMLMDHVSVGDVPDQDDAQTVEAIIALLNDRLEVDFEEYKRSTIFRRVLRRARMLNVDLDNYRRLLEKDQAELTSLHFDLLIGVTSFFRDPRWFGALENEIDALVRSPIEPTRELRAWIAGCATGEEAYSIAILFDEAIRRAGSNRSFKVFATDVHSGALKAASAAVYAQDRLKDVARERLDRYFTQRADGTYQVASDLRHRIVFTQHDLLVDTPFTNLDLVTCRNLLIYLRPQAQRRALASLAYGLRVGGLLFLGSSESAGEMSAHFDVVSETGKIFRKRVHSRGMQRPQIPTRVSRRGVGRVDAPRPEARLLPLYDALLDRFMPPGFLLSETRALVDSYNGAEKLLQLARRRPTQDFLDLVPQNVRPTLSAALARIQREPGPATYHDIAWQLPDSSVRYFSVSVERLVLRNADPAYLVSLVEQREVREPAAVHEGHDANRLTDLEAELSQTRHNLQSTVEELEASNEELQATNEELVASNEELQSVNEELHSVNEELHTVNAEHQAKIAELTELNRDISHLLESIDVATVYLDRDLKIRKYTPRASSIFGLVEHDVGRYLASFNHQLHYPGLMDDVRSVRDGGPRIEVEVRSTDNRWYFVRLLPYRIGGDIQGVVVTLTDATALATAKERTRQLSAIVESIGDAVIGLSLDGDILTWNSAAEQLYGYSADEVVGEPISRIVPVEQHAALRGMLKEVARGEHFINAPALRVARSGEVLDIANTMSPIRDASGVVVGIATVDRDVREQKRLERRMRESERRYEDLYNHAPDMYLSIDPRSGRIVEFNETFLRMTGFAPDASQTMHILDLYPPEAQDAARECLARMRNGEPLNDVALRILRRNAEPLDVTLSSTAVTEPTGEVVGARAVMRDVTARRQAELKLAEAAKMREQFLAMVSHELRSPLHAINAAFQIIDSPDADEEHRKRSEAVVRRQTRQMVRLVDDLLDVSRIMHGKLQLERTPLNLADVVRAATDAIAPAFHSKGVLLVTEGMEDPLPMFGDPSRLTQVCTNLLHNALRFTPESRRVRVTCRREESLAVVEVHDEGRGIDTRDLANIFGMFVQSRQGLARTEGGLGLGLTIADRIVTSHGGHISAQSDGLGRGARFIVKLPLDPRAALTPRQASTRDGKLSIVVVEDQDDAREVLHTLLQLEGHEIATARDGREGLAVILEKRPQIGLLDIGLPEMNGYDLALEIRRHLGNSIKLVAMSGYGQAEDLRKAEAAGFDRHLTKPVDPRRLAVALRELGIEDYGVNIPDEESFAPLS